MSASSTAVPGLARRCMPHLSIISPRACDTYDVKLEENAAVLFQTDTGHPSGDVIFAPLKHWRFKVKRQSAGLFLQTLNPLVNLVPVSDGPIDTVDLKAFLQVL